MKAKPTITTQSRIPRPAAEMVEQHVNPNLNEYQFQFTMLDYEELVAQELIHSISSGSVDAAATEKRWKSLNRLNCPRLLC